MNGVRREKAIGIRYLPHHRSDPPGLIIRKSATEEPTRALRTAKAAIREVNIFEGEEKKNGEATERGESRAGKELDDNKERARRRQVRVKGIEKSGERV